MRPPIFGKGGRPALKQCFEFPARPATRCTKDLARRDLHKYRRYGIRHHARYASESRFLRRDIPPVVRRASRFLAALNLVSLPMGYLAGQCQPYGEGKSKAYKDGGSDKGSAHHG